MSRTSPTTPGSPRAPAEASAQQELLDLAREWGKAIVSNDAEAIGRYMADDWVIVGPNGTTDRRAFLSSVASGDVTHQAMDLIETARVRIYGDMAVLVGRVTNNGHYKGQPFSADEWTTDVFLKRDGRWLCVLSHITPAQAG